MIESFDFPGSCGLARQRLMNQDKNAKLGSPLLEHLQSVSV